MKPHLPLVALLSISFAGCAPSHISPYVPKKRDYSAALVPSPTETTQTLGSLWQEGRAASILFTDPRARHENDLVVIKVEEIADAKRQADTDIKRSSDATANVSAFLGQLAKLKAAKGAIEPQITGNSAASFKGSGATGRTERLVATVPAIVRKVLPNGNLFVEGHRVVLVNSEEQHFYISGVIRPIDIDQDNSVKSSSVADAEIEFTGRGVITDNQHQGLLSRYLGWIWPF